MFWLVFNSHSSSIRIFNKPIGTLVYRLNISFVYGCYVLGILPQGLSQTSSSFPIKRVSLYLFQCELRIHQFVVSALRIAGTVYIFPIYFAAAVGHILSTSWVVSHLSFQRPSSSNTFATHLKSVVVFSCIWITSCR